MNNVRTHAFFYALTALFAMALALREEIAATGYNLLHAPLMILIGFLFLFLLYVAVNEFYGGAQ